MRLAELLRCTNDTVAIEVYEHMTKAVIHQGTVRECFRKTALPLADMCVLSLNVVDKRLVAAVYIKESR